MEANPKITPATPATPVTPKKPYQRPAFRHERVFETRAASSPGSGGGGGHPMGQRRF